MKGSVQKAGRCKIQFIRECNAEHIIVLTTVQSLGQHKSWNLPYKHGKVICTVDKLVFNVVSKIMWL